MASPNASRPPQTRSNSTARPTKPPNPRSSTTPGKSSAPVKKPVRSRSVPTTKHTAHKSGASNPKSGASSPKASANSTTPKTSVSTPARKSSTNVSSSTARNTNKTSNNQRSAQTHYHTHRVEQNPKTAGLSSSQQPVYYVRCSRKHYDDGFYSRCQRVLRQWVTWNDPNNKK